MIPLPALIPSPSFVEHTSGLGNLLHINYPIPSNFQGERESRRHQLLFFAILGVIHMKLIDSSSRLFSWHVLSWGCYQQHLKVREWIYIIHPQLVIIKSLLFHLTVASKHRLNAKVAWEYLKDAFLFVFTLSVFLRKTLSGSESLHGWL